MEKTLENFDFGRNLLTLRKKKSLSQDELAKKLGVSGTAVGRWEKNIDRPRQDKLEELARILGVSEVELRGLSPSYNGAHTIGETMYVPLVNQYAYAGYLSGFADNEFIESLDKVPFEVDREGRGNYMCFEVRGDSMDDGSYDSLRQGTKLLAREIQRHHWNNKFHNRRYKNFVIVHRNEGILIKQIKEHDLINNAITIHSLNPEFEDKVLNLDDIAQIFNVVKRQIDE